VSGLSERRFFSLDANFGLFPEITRISGVDFPRPYGDPQDVKKNTSTQSSQKETGSLDINPQGQAPPEAPPGELMDPHELLAKEGLLRVHKRGRPPLAIDPYHVELLASCLCTKAEIALKLGCSDDTIARRFSAEFERGRATAKCSLRALQMRACIKGRDSVLIFLGKNELGQRDNLDPLAPKEPENKAPHEYSREQLYSIARRGLTEKRGEDDFNAGTGGGGAHKAGRGDGKPPRVH
jgi:hypothetical protein